MHDPLEDWAEKDRLLAEIGVEPTLRSGPEPPPPPPAPPLGPARIVRRPPPVHDEPPSLPAPPRSRPSPHGRRAVASGALLGIGVVWLAAGAGAGSVAACLAGIVFLTAGATAALLLNNA